MVYEAILPALRAVPSQLHHFSCCTWIWILPSTLVLLPFVALLVVNALGLAIFMPLAIIVFMIEHNLKFLWFFLLLFIHAGGLADLVADFQMLITTVRYWVPNTYSTESEEGESEEEDEELMWIRILLTLWGALPFLWFLLWGRCCFNRVSKDLGKGEMFGDSSSSLPAGHCTIWLTVVLWKVAMVFLRLFLLLRVAYELVRYRTIRTESKKWIEWAELLLLADLIWSGIPLGVLTFMELLFYSPEGFEVILRDFLLLGFSV